MRLFAAITVFTATMGLLVWIAAGALTAASKRAVTYRYISDALQSPVTPTETVQWLTPDADLDRPVTAADQTLIGIALSDAWQALSVAQSTTRKDILVDVFSGVALDRATQSVEDAQASGGRIAVLRQAAEPVFYHRDGSVFQAEVELIVSRFMASDGRTDQSILTKDRGIVTLMNESVGWRVFSYELRGSEPLETTATPATLSGLKGINYYPANTPWRDFWPAYDPAIITADFDRIADLGANAVRVFLPRDDFLDADDRETRLADLSDLIARADTAGLMVIPTLFDLKPAYGPGTWAADSAYLQWVLPTLGAADNVAFIDLKNEPDLDFETHGKPTVTAWLEAMTALVRQQIPDVALTVGWSDAGAAGVLAAQLDVITYHDYAPIAGATARLADVRAIAGSKPVMVTEIGASSYDMVFGFPSSSTSQADALASRLAALAQSDGVFIWTLHDFPSVDPTAVGASPWVRRLQSAFGLIAIDGSEKPAAEVVRAAFADNAAH